MGFTLQKPQLKQSILAKQSNKTKTKADSKWSAFFDDFDVLVGF